MKITKFPTPIYVTRPLLPDRENMFRELAEIWDSQWLTNMGKKHNQLENELKTELKVHHLSLFNNGTIALLTAIKAFNFPPGSEIITTPFTFAATTHCIVWNGFTPIFCDIEPETMTIDPQKIESLITPKTVAILPVHVYGFPCDVNRIQEIADHHHLKVIYDGAHVFSTTIHGNGIGSYGDITMFSFHATKLFNTVEGGCLAYSDPALQQKLCNLRNFGTRDEETVEAVGINGKMNEVQAAIGLLNLRIYREEQEKRIKIRAQYKKMLHGIKGIKIPEFKKGITDSAQYFPIIIENASVTRDMLYTMLKEYNIFARKYFYPITAEFPFYRNLSSAKQKNLPVAFARKEQILCLPFYGALSESDITNICNIIKTILR